MHGRVRLGKHLTYCLLSSSLLQYLSFSSYGYYSVCHFVFMSCCVILHGMTWNKNKNKKKIRHRAVVPTFSPAATGSTGIVGPYCRRAFVERRNWVRAEQVEMRNWLVRDLAVLHVQCVYRLKAGRVVAGEAVSDVWRRCCWTAHGEEQRLWEQRRITGRRYRHVTGNVHDLQSVSVTNHDVFRNLFFKDWKIVNDILRAYSAFKFTPNCKVSFSGLSRLIWHNFVKVMDNWMNISSLV